MIIIKNMPALLISLTIGITGCVSVEQMKQQLQPKSTAEGEQQKSDAKQRGEKKRPETTGNALFQSICKSKQARQRLATDEKFRDKVVMSLSEAELAQSLSLDIDYKVQKCILARQIEVSTNVNVLVKILESNYYDACQCKKEKMLLERLARMAKDEKTLRTVLNMQDRLHSVLDDESLRKVALQKLTEPKAVAYVLDRMEYKHNNYCWINGDAQALIDALNVAVFAKDDANITKILIAVCTKRAGYGNFGARNTKYENVEDPVVKHLKCLKHISPAIVKAVFAANDEAWKYLIDRVDSNLAYEMLANGLSRTEEMETEILKRLDKSRLDMTIYTGARFEKVKKTINASLTPEMKAKATEQARVAFSQIVKTSQKQSAVTFALDGFYLGMPFADAKIVLAQHFPQMKIRETTDGDDADLVIYLPGQESPFCYANAKDKKVYQFNFGKKLLKKWYPFDVQNDAEWALKYAVKTGDRLRYEMLTKDTVVDDSYRTYRLWFYQHTYQYKNNKKGYRITYFGDMKDFTGETGMNALYVKEKALKQLRYVRGDEGSLRVRVELE